MLTQKKPLKIYLRAKSSLIKVFEDFPFRDEFNALWHKHFKAYKRLTSRGHAFDE